MIFFAWTHDLTVSASGRHSSFASSKGSEPTDKKRTRHIHTYCTGTGTGTGTGCCSLRRVLRLAHGRKYGRGYGPGVTRGDKNELFYQVSTYSRYSRLVMIRNSMGCDGLSPPPELRRCVLESLEDKARYQSFILGQGQNAEKKGARQHLKKQVALLSVISVRN
jgi:hypothetical protein